jgi:hypothetical protein
MNWRRGLLLAVINLVAAVPLILMLDARDEQSLRENEWNAAVAARESAAREAAREPAREAQSPSSAEPAGEEQTVFFNPCEMWVHYPVQVRVVLNGNPLASELTGWRLVCPEKWMLSGMLLGPTERAWTASTMPAHRQVDAGLCLLILVQWLLVGAFPLRKPRRWWAEPGMFITSCTVVAVCFALIPPVDEVAHFPVFLAGCAWFWWFGLLAWKLLRLGWRRAAGWLTPLKP